MYGILMLLTLIAFIAIGDVIIVTSFAKDKHSKKHPWRLLWFISLIAVIFILDKTGSFTNYKEVAKHLDKKWYVVYENNINADVTVTSGDMKLNPKKLITKGNTEKFFSSNDTLMGTLRGVKSERWHFYYTHQVCELDEFGLKFGFFESGCKSRYNGICNCLNIKASISQKKFFLTTL